MALRVFFTPFWVFLTKCVHANGCMKFVEVVSFQYKQFPLTFELFEENCGHDVTI